MMINRKTAATLMLCGLLLSDSTPSAVAQEAKKPSGQEVSPAIVQEETQQAPATASKASATSAPEAKLPSSSDPTLNANTIKASSDSNVTNAPSSNAQSDAAGAVPTDPSMTPLPSITTENTTKTPLPTDPNEESVTEIPREESAPVSSTESIEKKKHEVKVRYNEVRTHAEKEEAVTALCQAADNAATAEGKRQTLRAYYELLFKRMKQIDPSLTVRCDVMQAAYLRRLEQTKIEPIVSSHLPAGEEQPSTNIPQEVPPTTQENVRKKASTSDTSP